jgi:pimeloyl-ACP methyl ester carboxylesterase/predicted glycosyltransferase
MRARAPDRTGYVWRDGVRVHYEVCGHGDPTILFLPTWSVVHSRVWKAQVPYFARHHCALTFDGRGNGLSDRPGDPAAYAPREFALDAIAVMDATATERAILVSLSLGSIRSLHLAAEYPDRVLGSVFVAPSGAYAPQHPGRVHPFHEPPVTEEGWAKYNAHYWRKDFRGFLEFFFSQMFTEPHSTKQIEDCVGWGLETDPATLIATVTTTHPTREELLALCARVRCPVLVIHGDEDAISPIGRGEVVAEATGGNLVTIAGGGHGPHARDPVRINTLIRDFVERRPRPPSVWTRARRRGKRALFVSSPIGLGHARRDVAIARELRSLVPGLEIDWLAMDPVTRVLEAEGERIHPASVHLANESRHIEEESGEHELDVFEAWRRMDEIFVANFMVFHDVVTTEAYDLWIGDEAWEVDYHLHENPELKRAAYVWLTDFVGWLPMPEGGEREATLTADYNTEMIRHIERYPRVRDRAIFVGDPDDIVEARFGPGLPWIREWTEAHYAFCGYISGFDPGELPPRDELRAGLGYAPDEEVCIVSVGGSSVGEPLLRRVIDGYDEAKRRVPGLRMVVVAGPRIDPAGLPERDGLEVRGYLHGLYRHLAACDLALVQGGLTTTMELTANRRPFIYFPLRRHCEQNIHVHHRLRRYGAGRRVDYGAATPASIADAIASEIGRPVSYRPVETGGARRAAQMIAELL